MCWGFLTCGTSHQSEILHSLIFTHSIDLCLYCCTTQRNCTIAWNNNAYPSPANVRFVLIASNSCTFDDLLKSEDGSLTT